jgi:hypothetical protein
VKIVRHGRCITFQRAEVKARTFFAMTRSMRLPLSWTGLPWARRIEKERLPHARRRSTLPSPSASAPTVVTGSRPSRSLIPLQSRQVREDLTDGPF